MDMHVSAALLADGVVQMQASQTAQDVQIKVLEEAMDRQESASAALLNPGP
jgi:hypothetical protein